VAVDRKRIGHRWFALESVPRCVPDPAAAAAEWATDSKSKL
jgi:hypothetical protein